MEPWKRFLYAPGLEPVLLGLGLVLVSAFAALGYIDSKIPVYTILRRRLVKSQRVSSTLSSRSTNSDERLSLDGSEITQRTHSSRHIFSADVQSESEPSGLINLEHDDTPSIHDIETLRTFESQDLDQRFATVHDALSEVHRIQSTMMEIMTQLESERLDKQNLEIRLVRESELRKEAEEACNTFKDKLAKLTSETDGHAESLVDHADRLETAYTEFIQALPPNLVSENANLCQPFDTLSACIVGIRKSQFAASNV